MKQLSFAKTEKEIKKDLDFFKQAYVKLKCFGTINLLVVESEIVRLSKKLKEIEKDLEIKEENENEIY